MECNALIGKLKQAEALTHYWHLRTKSYAKHMALGGFYEGLQGLTDAIAEAVVGKYGLEIEIPQSISLAKPEDHEAYLKELGSFVDSYIVMYNKDLELQDYLLDIRNLINKTLYLFRLS
jgi:hypothetical protein